MKQQHIIFFESVEKQIAQAIANKICDLLSKPRTKVAVVQRDIHLGFKNKEEHDLYMKAWDKYMEEKRKQDENKDR